MAKEQVLFLLLGGMGVFLFLALGIAMACSDLGCGMFFCYKDGGIYSAKSGRRLADDTPANRRRRLADDTPANRRRISRWMGLFFITVGSLAAFGALAVIRLG